MCRISRASLWPTPADVAALEHVDVVGEVADHKAKGRPGRRTSIPLSGLAGSVVSVGYVFESVASMSPAWCSTTGRSLTWTRP